MEGFIGLCGLTAENGSEGMRTPGGGPPLMLTDWLMSEEPIGPS